MSQLQTCPKCGATLSDDGPDGMCPGCLVHAGFRSVAVSPSRSVGDDSAIQPTLKSPANVDSGFAPPLPDELAPLFPQIEILELIGKGGMGAVYKARQRELDRIVALKILPPETATATGFAQRFTREAQALAKLNHPNIVTIHDFGRAGSLYYFVMECVDGVNLRQLMHQKKLPPVEALKIVPQICDALQYAHEEGIVHRDIKPENILLDRRGRVKITDFGLAKLLNQDATDSRLTGTGQVMGTWHYMAPEQLENPLGVDYRADIYSLGVVFYEMLTGELPLGRFALPSEKVQLDIRLDDVVIRSLEREPGRRYQHASEIKEKVDQITNDPSAESARADCQLDPTSRRESEHPRNNWMSRLLDVEPEIGEQLIHAIPTVLLVAGVLLFVAMAFRMLDQRNAILGGIACILTSVFFPMIGRGNSSSNNPLDLTSNTKLQAALAMSPGPDKDQVLAKVAREAVEECESSAALSALLAIRDAGLRDETAATSALEIAENEGCEAALTVAKMIQQDALRNDVLQKLVEM